VAVLHHASVAVPPPETFAKFGLTLEPFLWQGASLSHPETARRLAHLMVRRQQDHPPDALFIGDDNFVEYATAGIIDAGARVGEDLEVVGHCNFPWPTPSAIPLRRLGYDVREFLDVSLKTLQQQRDGQEHPPYTVPARFEDELTFPQ
jgi:DNA-binding LacI/PurR family transcriptional regulator